MPPTASPRRTRVLKPVEDVPLDEPVLGEVPVALKARRQARRVQAATADAKVRLPEGKRALEVADGGLVAPVSGRYFRLSDTMGMMPLMEWAAAQEDVDPGNQQQLVGLYRILKDLVLPDDWAEFREFTRDAKCDAEAFITFVNAAIEAIAARPTEAPATS